MRVTAKVKKQTRERILSSARKLFQEKGFDETTTRDIAGRARIAAGTLFNYFPTKEALALSIVSSCFDDAGAEFQERLRGEEALDERLFAHVATGLRHLGIHRGYIENLMESTLSPFAKSSAAEEAEEIRLRHLETVRELIVSNTSNNGSAQPSEPLFVTLHLYWTLFLGVLAYWARDESPDQEDTLVLLDQSMKLFVNSLSAEPIETVEVTDGATRS